MKNIVEYFYKSLDRYCVERKTNIKSICTEANVNYDTLLASKRRNAIPKAEFVYALAYSLKVSISYFYPPIIEDGSSHLIEIPFLNQKVSAGSGQEIIAAVDCTIKQFSVMDNLAKKYPKDSLYAAEVVGDSMVEANIDDEDIVIFSAGLIKGDGIYVISVQGDVFVKRLQFNPYDQTITIISDNKHYEPRVVPADDSVIRIIGKVVTCIHEI